MPPAPQAKAALRLPPLHPTTPYTLALQPLYPCLLPVHQLRPEPFHAPRTRPRGWSYPRCLRCPPAAGSQSSLLRNPLLPRVSQHLAPCQSLGHSQCLHWCWHGCCPPLEECWPLLDRCVGFRLRCFHCDFPRTAPVSLCFVRWSTPADPAGSVSLLSFRSVRCQKRSKVCRRFLSASQKLPRFHSGQREGGQRKSCTLR